MPPIIPLRTDLGQVLEVDKDLIGFESAKFVFTDITFGISDKVINFSYVYCYIVLQLCIKCQLNLFLEPYSCSTRT